MRRQQGFSLVAAIFLIVVLAMLGLFAVKITNGSQQTADLRLLGSRAMSAASAGIEWGAYQVVNAPVPACPSPSTTFALNERSLGGFTVTVECSLSAVAEQGGTTNIFALTSTAQFGTYGQAGYVRRVVKASINRGA